MRRFLNQPGVCLIGVATGTPEIDDCAVSGRNRATASTTPSWGSTAATPKHWRNALARQRAGGRIRGERNRPRRRGASRAAGSTAEEYSRSGPQQLLRVPDRARRGRRHRPSPGLQPMDGSCAVSPLARNTSRGGWPASLAGDAGQPELGLPPARAYGVTASPRSSTRPRPPRSALFASTGAPRPRGVSWAVRARRVKNEAHVQ